MNKKFYWEKTPPCLNSSEILFHQIEKKKLYTIIHNYKKTKIIHAKSCLLGHWKIFWWKTKYMKCLLLQLETSLFNFFVWCDIQSPDMTSLTQKMLLKKIHIESIIWLNSNTDLTIVPPWERFVLMVQCRSTQLKA